MRNFENVLQHTLIFLCLCFLCLGALIHVNVPGSQPFDDSHEHLPMYIITVVFGLLQAFNFTKILETSVSSSVNMKNIIR